MRMSQQSPFSPKFNSSKHMRMSLQSPTFSQGSPRMGMSLRSGTSSMKHTANNMQGNITEEDYEIYE